MDNLDLEWPGEATVLRGLEEEEVSVDETIPRPIFEDIFVFDH